MATGTVKWFNATKGYGFITPDDGGKDAFVHISEVERSGLGRLTEGQKVNFSIRQEPRGLKAVDLTAVD
jgi:CspA family cold shock protein